MKTKFYSGSAIILTILGIAAMTTIALGVAQLVPRDFRQSQALEASLQAENAAWGGVEHGLLLLKSAQAEGKFFSLSGTAGEPYGAYSASQSRTNCMTQRDACPGFDRQLGNLQNGQPVIFNAPLSTPDTDYSLVVWHKRQGVGNTQLGLEDGLIGVQSELNKLKDAPNINPMLDRDEVRRLDVAGVGRVVINWKPIWNSQCQYDGGLTKMWLVYSLLNENNEIIDRNFATASETQGTPIQLSNLAQAKVLSLRLLTTNTSNLDPNSSVDEFKIRGCFIRYNLDTTSNSQDASSKTIDMGFDVIESTGVSGGVRRKIRVIVNRENGRLLNILDFGLACENCTGLD